ncbi:MAG: OmpP1/FadL family transporter [Bacteroidia bacterium]
MLSKIFSGICLFSLLQLNLAFAQVDNLSNLSPEWIRSAARNASTDGTDAVVYNPAGAVMLTEGFHISAGNQSLFRKPTHEYDLGYGNQKFSQDGSDAFLPNLFMSYNKNKMAYTGGVYVSGGGATASYPTGSITTDMIGMMSLMEAQGAYMMTKDNHFKASSYYITYMAGASYKASEKIAIGVNIKYLSGTNKVEAGTVLTGSPVEFPDMPLTYKTEDKASGIGATIGMYFNPCESTKFSIRYETMVPMEFKTKVITDDLGISEDGEKYHRDLPAVLALGVKHSFNDKFTTLADFNYYMQTGADWGKTMTMEGEKPTSDLAGNAATYALALEYKATDNFLFSIGSVYTNFGWENVDAYYTNAGAFETVPGNNLSLNTGFKYNLTPNIAFNAGMATTVWSEEMNVKALNFYPMDVDVKVNNKITAIAFGIDVSL